MEPVDMNRDEPLDLARQRQALSALMDGDAGDADLAVQAWRVDARARADWHTYHVIGETLRSDDVRCSAQRDAAFLAGLRTRLAREPVVLAPTAASVRPARSLKAWARPMAVAAGFAAVAAVLVVTRLSGTDSGVADRSAVLASQGMALPALAAASEAEGELVRSPELDRYLAAHRQYSLSALAAPGGLVRNAAVTVPGR